MPASLDGQLVVAISSRALFDFEQENAAFDPSDDAPYRALQLSRLDVPAPHGVAFPLVRKLLKFNAPQAGITPGEVVRTAGADEHAAIMAFLYGEASEATRATIGKATTPAQLVALALGSPEFQRR